MADFETWGERLFPNPVSGKKGQSLSLRNGRVVPSASLDRGVQTQFERQQRVYKLVKGLVKKSPEVMVKITGNGKTLSKIKAHIDYISRNGKVELEDQDGLIFSGKGVVSDILDDWAQSGGIPKREIHASKRETFNVVLSMPAGTDRDALKNAAREFAEEAFYGHEWFMAEHRDTNQPHVHLCVKTSDSLGYRLNPKKADLQKWRELFADKLKEHGVEANATRRQVRGKTRRSKTQAQHHSSKNKRLLNTEKRQRTEIKNEIKTGIQKNEPLPLAQTKRTRNEILRNMKGVVKSLHEQGDVKLALDLITYVKELPIVESKHEYVIRLHKQTTKIVEEGRQLVTNVVVGKVPLGDKDR